tara:strand:- start:158 stop:532 length:375 start_codon:yes stop_codon:yes gene_type:complete
MGKMVETTRKPFEKEINENIPINEQVEVGLGCTRHINGDAYSYTIVRVEKNGRTIWVTRDMNTPAEGYDYYTNQVYTHETNWDESNAECYTLRKDGKYYAKGGGMKYYLRLAIGYRMHKQDPHF